ncbi:hypothetical protein Prum_037540 [Phytohabitans rumicis]|uniref:Uncharacterized protein n=1 Tax=Phytohabitans rumicis TaxID=1076125 RepID=A0A6V8KYC5_9ACTN|nr:hypothetical protein Prum_037540 [Phytohabitans rumicis]
MQGMRSDDSASKILVRVGESRIRDSEGQDGRAEQDEPADLLGTQVADHLSGCSTHLRGPGRHDCRPY